MQCLQKSIIKYNTADVGKLFTDFYCSLNYKNIPGSSLLDPSVPMAFVMSAGLAQVESSSKNSLGINGSKFTLIQNCFRYFDLKNIGKSSIHLSLFQMPGAFTFGFHRKESDIHRTFSLLSKVFGFKPNCLWATYFAGDSIEGLKLEKDWETFFAWKEAGIPEKQIIGLKADHNFWKQNANFIGEYQASKCGTNTEVFFDRGISKSCSDSCVPPCTCGRFIEITNTLFINLHIDKKSKRISLLSEPFTETVIGAERISMLLQNASSVFNIDNMKPLINLINKFADIEDNSGGYYQPIRHDNIIADHIRAIVFLCADGAPPPGKGGRARLMRKLIRELLTSMKILNISEVPFLSYVIDTTINLYCDYNIHLKYSKDKALKYIFNESEKFENTLHFGYKQLAFLTKNYKCTTINGAEMLSLEKNYGLPFPLLEHELKSMEINFDETEYHTAYELWVQHTTR